MTWLAWFVFLLALVIVALVAMSIWRDRELDRLVACESGRGNEDLAGLLKTATGTVDKRLGELHRRIASLEKWVSAQKDVPKKDLGTLDDLYVRGNATVAGMLKLGNVVLDAESQDKITICDARGRNCMRLCCTAK